MSKINLRETCKFLNKVAPEYRKPGLTLSKFSGLNFFEQEQSTEETKPVLMCTIFRNTSYGRTSMFMAAFSLENDEEMWTVTPVASEHPEALDMEECLQEAASVITTMIMEP